MKVSTRISVSLGTQRPGTDSINIVVNEDQLRQLVEIYPKGQGKGGFSAEIPEADERYAKIVALIYGWTGRSPKHGLKVLTNEQFAVFRTREFSDAELEHYQFFRMRGLDFIADLDAQTLDQHLIVKANKTLASKCEIGGIPPTSSIGVTTKIREQLETENLVGLSFREVLFSKPLSGQKELAFQFKERIELSRAAEKATIYGSAQATKAIWQITSDVSLPPVLNRVFDAKNRELTGENRHNCFVEDDAFPSVLRYSRLSIESLLPFDVAQTQETMGVGERNATPDVIVSKRGMRVFRKLTRSGVSFVPIELVDLSEITNALY